MAVGMTTTTIQPCEIDTYISSNAATTNYGNVNAFQAGYYNGIKRHGLIKFDLSSIPSGETCDSAVLSLWIQADLASSDMTFSLHRLLLDWVELQATYNIYSTGNNWPDTGALGSNCIDMSPMGVSGTISATTAASENLNTEIQITITDKAEFKKMYDGTYTNYGWLIKETEEEEGDLRMWGFHSSEASTSGYRPKLVVTTHATEAGVYVPRVIMF